MSLYVIFEEKGRSIYKSSYVHRIWLLEIEFKVIQYANLSCNRSKTSARVSSGDPNTEKRMKAQGRLRPSAFIVSRYLDSPDETRSTSF